MEEIKSEKYSNELGLVREWGGADVVIRSNLDKNTERWLEEPTLVVSGQNTIPKRRAVITPCSKELSWLFYKLKEIFRGEIDFTSKYDFYGLLAQEAIEYLELYENNVNCKMLLISVLKKAKNYSKVPSNTNLPLFAYGLFKPGELAFYKIKELTDTYVEAKVNGKLKLRDGVPILVKNQDLVRGYLIKFQSGLELEAYSRIMEIEPEKIYKWEEIVTEDGTRCNTLIGRKPRLGTSYYEYRSWNSKNDPYFSVALDEIRDILNDEENQHPNGPDDPKSFLRLQMAYMLLWVSIERYASMKYHLGADVHSKIKQIAQDETFVKSLKRHVNRTDNITGAHDLEKYKLNARNPKKSIEYYYQIRSNSVHRGKMVYDDHKIIQKALKELLAIFEDLIRHSFDVNGGNQINENNTQMP